MARLMMVLSVAFLLAPPGANAQEPAAAPSTTETTAVEATAIEPSIPEAEDSISREEATLPEEPVENDCNGVYCKTVKGMLWIEGTAGPARFNVTKFRSINLLPEDVGTLQPNVQVSGGEYGVAIGAQFDIFSIGGRFKYAKFSAFDLLTAGIDFGFLLKFVPYVAPYARFGLYYNTTPGGSPIPGLDQILENFKVRGGSASIGAGVRVPIIKWLSVAIGFDYSFVALYVTGFSTSAAEDFSNGTIGGEIAGTFALTVHPI
jgi:hypothetical protein